MPKSAISTRDIARLAARVRTTSGHEGRAYAFTGLQALLYGHAANILSQVLHRKIDYVALSDGTCEPVGSRRVSWASTSPR